MKLFFICILLLLSGCGSPDSDGSSAQDPSLPPRTTVTEFLLPSADGTDVYGNDFVSIDASNTSEGYVMVRYTGPADKSRLQMTAPDGTLYSYFLSTPTITSTLLRFPGTLRFRSGMNSSPSFIRTSTAGTRRTVKL